MEEFFDGTLWYLEQNIVVFGLDRNLSWCHGAETLLLSLSSLTI